MFKETDIAIIGIAGRFPGSDDPHSLWEHVLNGEELLRKIEKPNASNADENYVAVVGEFDGVECFDAAFFGYLPGEAKLMDPQQRHLLECSWAALEDAGYDPTRLDHITSVFAGVGKNAYFSRNIVSHPDLLEATSDMPGMLAVEKDYAATRIAYKLNLKGPAINVQSACSTSGTAVHLACQSLISGESEIALAAGARVLVPTGEGYTYFEEGPLSSDGHCRPFDAQASGMVRSSGAAVVVLKRATDALADNDHIYAVIKSTALNNDGSDKIGFTAPSVRGQEKVIKEALELAELDSSQISYVEAHGTGTPVGDPIEFAALTNAFRASTSKTGYCGIGSVKSNIGHLDAAAGLAGIIKSALALQKKVLPATINFSAPNPQLDIANSPFYICDKKTALDSNEALYFGVSSFGLGGTNFHSILASPPASRSSKDMRELHLLKLSADTEEGLANSMRKLADRLAQTDYALTDVALTLDKGRKACAFRKAVACHSRSEAINILREKAGTTGSMNTATQENTSAGIVFMYPGGGAQYFRMAQDLYAREKIFAQCMDKGLDILHALAGLDYRQLWLEQEDLPTLNLPSVQLPLIFLTEYALTELLGDWGIRPDAVIGHSMGEMTAACVSGVMSFEDTVKLIYIRGKALENAKNGVMLSVTLPEQALRGLIPDSLDLAVINAPEMCVVSGPEPEIQAFAGLLEKQDIDHQLVRIATAAHSRLLDPELDAFEAELAKVSLSPPRIPIISNVSGDFHDAESATSARYWRDQLRSTVRFSQGIQRLSEHGTRYFLEVGPGNNLGALARMTLEDIESEYSCTSTLRHVSNEVNDNLYLLESLGTLWSEGYTLPLDGYYKVDNWHKVPLPTYSFKAERHWIDPARVASTGAQPQTASNVVALHPREAVAASASSAPVSVESAVASLITELTGIPESDLDPQARFVDLGLDSLLLSKLGLKLKKSVGARFTLRDLMGAYGTLQALAERISATAEPAVIESFTSAGIAVIDSAAAVPVAAGSGIPGAAQNTPPLSPEAHVKETLKTIFEDIAGISIDDFPASGGFVDAGFDSLLLSQVGVKLKKAFGLRVSLKTLLNEANRPELLGNYILAELPTDYFDKLLPAEATAPDANNFAASPAAGNRPAVPALSAAEITRQLSQLSGSQNSSVRIIANQLKLLNEQMALLKLLREAELAEANERARSHYPATSGQREIWATCQFSEEVSCSYNLSTGIELKGAVDKKLLEQAFHEVLVRHDSLRSRFSNDGTKLHVEKADAFRINYERLEGDAEQKIEVERLRETQTPFQLNKAPLIRARLLEIDEQHSYLLITVHHIIADGISLGIILRELAEIYSAGVEGKAHSLPGTIPTAEAIRQLEYSAEDHQYWHDELADCPASTELPADFPRPNIKQYSANVISHTLDADTQNKLQKFSRENGVTLFSLLLASFQVYLSKLCPQQDVIIGVPVNNIDRSDYNLVGYYLSVAPIRASIQTDKSYLDYVQGASDHIFECLEHTNCTFGEIVEELGFRRDLSRNTLISVLFNLDSESAPPVFAGTQTKTLPVPKAYENFDLFMSVIPGQTGLKLQCTYNTSLFRKDTISRWLDGFDLMLQNAVENPARQLEQISAASPAELEQIARWNDSARHWPTKESLLESIAGHAQRQGAQACLESSNQRLSYSELESRSSELANVLVASGVKPGDLVGACFHRTPGMIIGLLAIWKAGGAYVPLDPNYPASRLRYMLEMSHTRHIVTHRGLDNIVPEYECSRICIDDFTAANAEPNGHNAQLPGPSDIAYVIFTSGSTGNPKGVKVPHSCVLNFLHSMAESPGFGSDDRLLAVTTLSFDIAVLELWLPLLRGGTVVIADSTETSDGMALARLIEKFNINKMQATPGTWRLLLDNGWQGGESFVALCGGEPLPGNLAAELAPKIGALWNMYGPTETTVWSTAYRIDPDQPLYIGKPIANTQCHVLDDRLEPQPIGVPGELYIGGDGVTAGYLNQPELTAERFVKDPFSNNENSQLYRTGDLVRWHSDGQLQFLGRIDNQVKLRGFRIELGEIETAISKHPDIGESVAAVREDKPGDQRLVAYLTLSSGDPIEKQQLRSFLADSLPGYMIPQLFVTLKALPRTPNGKIDRKNLPAPEDLNVAAGKKVKVALGSEGERYLAGLWAEFLEDDSPIYPEDNFFDIGGHSLLAAQLCSRIREQRGVDVPVFDVITSSLGQIAANYLAGEENTIVTADTEKPGRKSWLTSLKQRMGLGGAP
ncbi:MAG: amino acid adenylation domain-containing protein [Pseudomonadales bacterium]